MPRDFSLAIFLVGLVRVFVWWAGAALAWYRKRWAVCAGFALAGCNAIIFSFTSAQAEVPAGLADTSAVLGTPIVGLIVFGFIAAQPKRARRPHRWSP